MGEDRGGEEDPEIPRKTEQQKAQDRAEIFDAVCRRNELTHKTLREMPAEWLADLLKAEGQVVHAGMLPAWVAEYLAGKGA